MLDCGTTRLYELIANGELESYRDGKSRKITVASIKARVARMLAESRGGAA
jgi:excisionase family DNA binding protein